MLEFAPPLNKKLENLLSPILNFLHLKLKLSPDSISIISGVFGFVSIFSVILEKWKLAIIFIAISWLFDIFDGQTARKFELVTSRGRSLDLAIDRILEFTLLLTLFLLGKITLKITLLVAIAIILIASLKHKTRIDFGFKKLGMLLGCLIGFDFALSLVFFITLAGFVLNLIILDYQDVKSNL